MFGLSKKKSVDFGSLLKEKGLVVLLFGEDFDSWDALFFLLSCKDDFKKVVLKPTVYLRRFCQTFFEAEGVKVAAELDLGDKRDAIVLDFCQNKAELKSFENSIILSGNKKLGNFTFSPAEPVLKSFATLFNFDLDRKRFCLEPKSHQKSEDLILFDKPFDKKIKRMQETHRVVCTAKDPVLQEKDFMEIFDLALKTKKLYCFTKERQKMWQLLGFDPILLEKKQDYAKIF